jgi:hypothetical protein
LWLPKIKRLAPQSLSSNWQWKAISTNAGGVGGQFGYKSHALVEHKLQESGVHLYNI